MKKLLLSRWLRYLNEQNRERERNRREREARARLAGSPGRSGRFDLENLESRLMMAGDPLGAVADGLLTGSLTSGDDQVVVARTGRPILSSA